MYRVDVGRDISNRRESVQPADHRICLLFQNDGSPSSCERPPLLDAASLLLLRRGQGLVKRQIDVADVMGGEDLNNCSIIF